ncbi:unnamed protein product [Allacma fusca]|uniref:Nucleotidyltransferase n=1 Tax=Allacma fusca TaxID=39272 RepID=A0A8J2J5X1_9HEXA|nr:unnamed protein product [Allacma fusca]
MYSARLNNDLMRTAAAEVENLKAYKAKGNIIFDKVSKFIKSKSRYGISRQLIAGSTGKNTSLGHNFEPDFDVILFVRDVSHLETLKPVIEDFHKILSNFPSRSEAWTRFVMKSPSEYSIQFSVDTIIMLPTGPKQVTIDFDLLPAYDFCSNVDQQTRMVLDKIRMSRDRATDNYKFSGSLAEKTVEFVNSKTDFVRRFIRLTKLWDTKLRVDRQKRDENWNISGRSSIIELIAIQAAEKSGDNILEAFRKFLELMMNLNMIKINFSKQDPDQYSTMTIIDTVNPYHNYADGLKASHVNGYVARASDSLRALQHAETSGVNYDKAMKDFMAYFATA